MQLKHLLEKTFIAVSLFIFVVFSAYANPNTFEVREVAIPTQNAATGMITINFDAPFDVIPLVFSLATTRGANPCAARISNVTLTSFVLLVLNHQMTGLTLAWIYNIWRLRPAFILFLRVLVE